MNKPSKRNLYSFLLVLFLFLFQAFVYDDFACSISKPVWFQDFTHISLVQEPDKPEFPQILDDSVFGNHDENQPPFALDHALKKETESLCTVIHLFNNGIINRHLSFSKNHTISILQKKNHWHQSPDDEPPSRIKS